MTEPLRSEHYQRRFRSPGPNPRDVSLGEEVDVLFRTGDAGMKAVSGDVQQACDCGCLEPPGGFCSVCIAQGFDGIICESCFHRCSGCGVGLCLSHSFQIENPPGELRRLCPVCYEALLLSQKKQRMRNLILFPIKFLIWVFFKKVEKEDERLPAQQVEIHPLRPTQPRHLPFEIKRPSPQQHTRDGQYGRSE